MSYMTQARLAQDQDIQLRVTACAASKNIDADPQTWAAQRMWSLSAQTGWVEAYAAATGKPGQDESAITDEMISDAVDILAA